MNFQLREAAFADAPAVCNLSSLLGYRMSESSTLQSLEMMAGHADHKVWVAVLDNEVVGWVHAFKTLRLEGEPFVEIGGLIVDEPVRRQKLGSKLVKQVIAWCRETGVETPRVRCNTKRAGSHAFYLRSGFMETKEQKVFTLHVQQ